jgi:hypothetical protein
MNNKLDGRQHEFGELIRPLFEHLPEIPVGEWYRFSFDVVQLSSGVQVVHIRFTPIGDNGPARSKHERTC